MRPGVETKLQISREHNAYVISLWKSNRTLNRYQYIPYYYHRGQM